MTGREKYVAAKASVKATYAEAEKERLRGVACSNHGDGQGARKFFASAKHLRADARMIENKIARGAL